MNLQESLRMLGVADLKAESESSLKSKYRRILVKIHPDSPTGSREAFEKLKVAYANVTNAKNGVFVEERRPKQNTPLRTHIAFEDLLKVFKGGDVYDKYGKVDLARLASDVVLVRFELHYRWVDSDGSVHSGVDTHYIKREKSDTYYIKKIIEAQRPNIGAVFKLAGQEKVVECTSGMKHSTVFNFNYFATVELSVELKKPLA